MALWVVIVIAIVIVEVFWIARPAVRRGDLGTIENYLIQKLSQSGEPKLRSKLRLTCGMWVLSLLAGYLLTDS